MRKRFQCKHGSEHEDLCIEPVIYRGVCFKHYSECFNEVGQGSTTWELLVRQGRCVEAESETKEIRVESNSPQPDNLMSYAIMVVGISSILIMCLF